MARVYVYSWDNDDYSTIGECGALDATSCTFEEVGGGMSEISLAHPVDSRGKFEFLRPGAVLKVSVPVRTTPEIENGQLVTRVEKWKIKQTSTKQQRYVYTKKEKGRKSKLLKAGAEVVVTQKPEDGSRWKIKSGKVSGWLESDALENEVEITIPDTPAGIEEAAPAWECREQLFRIYKVNKADDGISCNARHIQYDLLKNLTSYDHDDAVGLQESGDGVLNACIDAHDFKFYTNITGTQPGAHYKDTDPVTAFLGPDSGLISKWGAQLVRDNFEIYALGNAGLDRGMNIVYAKNMLGVEMDEDTESMATAIRPAGKKKDGSPLYLPDNGLVMSERADQYPYMCIYQLECDDCTIGANGVTEAIALARMREQAQKMLDDGADLPEISVKVTFAQLGRGERYSAYRDLENVFLYDTVRVSNPWLKIDIKTQVVRIMWDCLREKMTAIELGSLQELTPTVASWQISGGINGSKLIDRSVGAAQIKMDAISVGHMQVDSVNANAIQAGAVTAEKIAAGSITADKIKTGALDATTINAITAKISTLTAKDIETDQLAAALAAFTIVTAGTATFDRATIQHLVAEAMHLSFGEAGTVFVRNLAVEYAQMIGAAIGNLCIKASDGNYYNIDVNQNGTVTAAKATVSAGEIAAGQTYGGQVILETNITAANLSTGNLLATYALVNRIDAARIDVDELFAREAFIDMLRTSRIFADKSLEIIVGEADSASRVFRQENFPDGDVLVKPGDMLVQPESGRQYQAVGAGFVSFALDENGDLYYEYTGDGSMSVEGFDLYADGFGLSVAGEIGTPYAWELVQDSDLANIANDALDKANNALTQAEFKRVVRVDDEGLHVGDNLTRDELLLKSGQMNVVLNGEHVATYAGKYMRFGNMQIRKVRGGLAISVYNG